MEEKQFTLNGELESAPPLNQLRVQFQFQSAQ